MFQTLLLGIPFGSFVGLAGANNEEKESDSGDHCVALFSLRFSIFTQIMKYLFLVILDVCSGPPLLNIRQEVSQE